MENATEDAENVMTTIPGGDYGIGPKAKKRDRFTAEMKDRQARGKDPMTGEAPTIEELTAEEKDNLTDGKGSAKIAYAGDGYEAVERRKRAMAILDSPELLVMYAQEKGDSIASSRYHLQHIMCGIEDERKPYKPSPILQKNVKNENVKPPSSDGNDEEASGSSVSPKEDEEKHEIDNENEKKMHDLSLLDGHEP